MLLRHLVQEQLLNLQIVVIHLSKMQLTLLNPSIRILVSVLQNLKDLPMVALFLIILEERQSGL